jgi:uncharacterized protein YjbI with pentapeptide repeats
LAEQEPESGDPLPDEREIPDRDRQLAQYLKTVQENKQMTLVSDFGRSVEGWMLREDLRRSKPGSAIRDIAARKTREVLEELNEAGKSEIFRLLYDYQLVGANGPIDLRGADLSGASLSKFYLPGIDLRGAKLRGANFTGADLRRAKLQDADLEGAHLDGSNLSGADLGGAILTRASLRGPETWLEGTSLYGAHLEGADFCGARISHVNFRESVMDKATQIDQKWRLNWRLLKRERVKAIDLSDVDLSGADLQGVPLRGCNLTNANLTNADLTDADLRETTMTGTNLQKAQLIRVGFLWRVYNKADLWVARRIGRKPDRGFMTIRVRGSHEADLAGAMLQEASLEGADVSPRQLREAEQILDTTMPDGTKYSSDWDDGWEVAAKDA